MNIKIEDFQRVWAPGPPARPELEAPAYTWEEPDAITESLATQVPQWLEVRAKAIRAEGLNGQLNAAQKQHAEVLDNLLDRLFAANVVLGITPLVQTN